jgi:anthranilate/para-aminobenzoate synthase component II
MSFKIRRISESLVFPEKTVEFPEEISLYTTNGNFTYFLKNVYNDGLTIKSTYSDTDQVNTNGELRIGEPKEFYIEFRIHTNENGEERIIVDILYGRSTKFQFVIQKPNFLEVTLYHGFGYKYDLESKFGFSDESIKDFVQCLNKIGFNFTEKHFQFMDKYPYNYQYHESLKISPLFDGIILVLNNAQPNRRSYLPNLENYLTSRGIEHIITTSVTEVDSILQKHNVLGVISAGSDYRISSSKNNELEQELSRKALKEIKKPLIAMCYGFQSMANFYGSEIKDSGKFFNDNIKLSKWLPDSRIFKDFNIDDYQFSVSFHDIISECPRGFRVIAEYEGNILGIDNDKLMRWGLAFHPEDMETTYPILDNFIEICKEMKSIDDYQILKFNELFR